MYIYICTYIHIYIYTGKMDKGKMVVNGAEPVPGAVCSTRRSRISDQQRARATCCTAVQLDSQPAA